MEWKKWHDKILDADEKNIENAFINKRELTLWDDSVGKYENIDTLMHTICKKRFGRCYLGGTKFENRR